MTDLQEGLGPRRPRLEHDGEDGEEDDLDGGAARVPVGAADAVLGGHRRGLQQGRRPRPLRDDGGGRQPDAHFAAGVEGGVEVVGVVVDVFPHHLEGLRDTGGERADQREDEHGHPEADRRNDPQSGRVRRLDPQALRGHAGVARLPRVHCFVSVIPGGNTRNADICRI